MKKSAIIFIVLFTWNIACFGEDTYKHKYNPWSKEKDWVVNTKDASDITLDTTDFGTSLTSNDTTVQKAMNILDDIVAPGGTAPINADYLVGTANAILSAEIIVGATPGGDLGGTWSSPSVDDYSHNHVITNINAFTEAELETQTSDVSNWIESGEIDTFSELDAIVADKILVNTTTDDDVPDAGDFGNATDLNANGALNANTVSDNEVDYTTVTLSDFTDDVGLFTSESDTLYSVVSRGSVAGASISASDILVTSGNASASVVDTQYIEYSSGSDLKVRDDLTIYGDISADNLKGNKTIQFTIADPDGLDEADDLIVWTNRTGFDFVITAVYSVSDTDNVDYDLDECDYHNNSTNRSSITDVTISTDGTGFYYNETIGLYHIVNSTNHIVFDADTACDFIQVTIVGSF